MKKLTAILVAIASIIILFRFAGLFSHGQDIGKKLEFNGGELFYTSSVTEAEAKRLGNYLVAQQFYDGKKKTAQLSKTDKIYEFRMVVIGGQENDPAIGDVSKTFAAQLSSDVFGGSRVDIHLCNDHLKTLRVVSAQ